MDTKAFFLALTSDWVALMSGIASVILAIVGIAKKWQQVPTWVFWLTAAACFFIAAGRVWTAEHRARLQLETRLAALEEPQLKLTIDQLGFGRLTADNHKTYQIAGFVIAHITNRGAPTIAEGWSMQVTMTDGRVLKANAMYMNPNYPMHLAPMVGGERVMAQADALYLKTMTPIQRGMLIRGVLAFPLAQYDEKLFADIQKAGTHSVLRCNDFNGKEVTAEDTFTGVPESLDYYPGVLPVPEK